MHIWLLQQHPAILKYEEVQMQVPVNLLYANGH